jgi:hypothetical protein
MVIWTPTTVGALELPHRLVMAPMTRDRSRADGVPSDLNREYYGKDFLLGVHERQLQHLARGRERDGTAG